MNVLVISLDCVRPEAIGAYPERFPVLGRIPYKTHTPNIDQIADDGIRFDNAICQAPFTPASHASLFTGRYPFDHGIRGMFGYQLKDDLPTMADCFKEGGYETGAFIGAHAMSAEYGLDRGFEKYDDEFDTSISNWIVGQRRPGSEVTNRALSWLSDLETEFLGFVHYFDAHDGGGRRPKGGSHSADDGSNASVSPVKKTYRTLVKPVDRRLGKPAKRSWRLWNRLRGRSDRGRRYHLSQVQRIDQQLGRLVDFLRANDLYDQTLLVVLADHGDAFGEHGEYGHREYLYDTTVRVPMIVKLPDRIATDVQTYDGVVRSVDVFPTAAAAADLDAPDVTGVDLLDHVSDVGRPLTAYAETRFERSPDDLQDLQSDLACLRSDRWKLVLDLLHDERELYDVEADPTEQDDVANSHPDVTNDLEEELRTMAGDELRKRPNMAESSMADVRDHLEGLGYL